MRFHLTTKQMILCALFTALTAVGAFIKVPIPVMPFTLQFLFTMLAGLLLGPRLGAISVGTYAVLGLLGLPIFAEGGGLWYLLKPTFGYIIGFVVGTYVNGYLAEKWREADGGYKIKHLLMANFADLAVVYIFGMVYYYVICNYVIDTPIALWPLFLYCFILAVPGDICLCILAAWLMKRVKNVI